MNNEIRNVTIITIGSLGDFIPYFALAKEFKRKGYTVTLASHEKYRQRTESEGLLFKPIKLNPEEMIRDAMSKLMLANEQNTLIFVTEMARVLFPFVESLIEDVEKAVKGSDVLLYSALVLGAPDAAQKYGVKAYAALLQPLTPTNEIHSSFSKDVLFGKLLYNKFSYHAAWLMFWIIFKDIVNNIRENRYELKRIKTLTPYLWHKKMGIRYIYGFSKYILQRPKDWDSSNYVTGFWFNDEAENFPEKKSFEEFINDSQEKPIYIGFGSMSIANEDKIEKIVNSVLRDTSERIVLFTGGTELKIDNDRVFSCDYMPHNIVFPKVKAVMHHGGSGTTSIALRNGIYQIIMPIFADQFLWGEQVFKHGFGLKPMPFFKTKIEKIVQNLKNMKIDESGKILRECSDNIKSENGTLRVVDIVEKTFHRKVL